MELPRDVLAYKVKKVTTFTNKKQWLIQATLTWENTLTTGMAVWGMSLHTHIWHIPK